MKTIGLPVFAVLILAGTVCFSAALEQNAAVELPAWQMPARVEAVPFQLDDDTSKLQIWGGGAGARHFFNERLPALFERTLALEQFEAQGELAWIFTGEHGGFTITIKPKLVELAQRYYDSGGFNEIPAKPQRHPEWKAPTATVAYTGKLQSVTVTLDHKLGLTVAANGREVLHQTCWLDVNRHQLRLTHSKNILRGKLLVPQAEPAKVEINSSRRHQEIIGFGGITIPTAYAQLSTEGKQQWWKLLAEYNLLIQREYPNGQRLNESLDNWDKLADAMPHYYADNFPNSEISDFDYIKRLRKLGGQVWFEFWRLPPWAENDVEKYADAMVNYCKVSRDKAGAPPEVIGIQNEVPQKPAKWHAMTLTLRRKLDAAGFKNVRIHMSDDGYLGGGIKRGEVFRSSREVWAAIDYSASHMYDYQKHFNDPDAFDAMLLKAHETYGDKPFLSSELCINEGRYQLPTYRIALLMGELYHKNFVLMDAVALCYCWTLLNVEQPSFGWTRTLCVPDPADDFIPKASSHQLRVFGAYSRRIREGMTRVDVKCDSPDLMVTAFEGIAGQRTVVMLNRSTQRRAAKINWQGAKFESMEVADPYHPNTVQAAPANGEITVDPGAILTLTSAALGHE